MPEQEPAAQPMPEQYRYEVATTERVTPVVRQLWLAPTGAPLPYRPGQYVLLGDPDWRTAPRSYSVANAPRPDGRVSVLVTRVEGGATSCWIHRLRAGAAVVLDGPYGTFVPEPGRTGPVLLLAAGSGLAPARALSEALLGQAPARAVTLFFSGRTLADAIDHGRFGDWQAARPEFRYLLTLTREPGAAPHTRIPALLSRTFETLAGWEVFASGPPGFVTGCAAAARTLGAFAVDVHTEEFFTEPQPWTDLPPAARPDASTATTASSASTADMANTADTANTAIVAR